MAHSACARAASWAANLCEARVCGGGSAPVVLTLASRRQPAKQVVIDAVFLVPSLCFRSLSEGRGLVLSHGLVTVAVLGLDQRDGLLARGIGLLCPHHMYRLRSWNTSALGGAGLRHA